MKKILHAFLLSMVIVFGFAQPVFVRAAGDASCDKLKGHFDNANAGSLAEKFPQYCSTGEVYKKVTAVLYTLIAIVGVIALMYGGYTYMLAGGNETQTKKGRDIIMWSVIGIIVVVLAAVIVNIAVRFLTNDKIF